MGDASKTGNFLNAFNSPNYTLNKDAADIINGGATPNTNRATFSDNQPGLCDIDDNWKVTPGFCFDSTSIQLTAVVTESGQAVTINKYFANAYTVNW